MPSRLIGTHIPYNMQYLTTPHLTAWIRIYCNMLKPGALVCLRHCGPLNVLSPRNSGRGSASLPLLISILLSQTLRLGHGLSWPIAPGLDAPYNLGKNPLLLNEVSRTISTGGDCSGTASMLN